MPLLLDTHVWLWARLEPHRLGPRSTRLLSNAKEAAYVATVSTLELARLVQAQQVTLPTTVAEWVASTEAVLGLQTIELSHEIAIEAYALPGKLHRDPVDRILVATARKQSLALLTADERILSYSHVKSVDVRR